MPTDSSPQPMQVFNSPLETGIRAACLLLAAYPAESDLQRLVQYDYLVVHSGDVADGPPSIHPATPHRGAELLVRRRVVEAGLLLMESKHVVQRTMSPSGIGFVAGEYALTFLDSLSTEYVQALRNRAEWVAQRFQRMSDSQLSAFMRNNWSTWGAEFLKPAFVEDLGE